MAWWLREMAALLEDQVPFPVPIWWLTTFCNTSSDGSMPPLASVDTACVCCTDTCWQSMPTHEIKDIYKLRAAREGGGHRL